MPALDPDGCSAVYGASGLERGGWNKLSKVLIFVKLLIKQKLIALRRR